MHEIECPSVELATFIGQEREIEKFCTLLADIRAGRINRTLILSVLGREGTGKTALLWGLAAQTPRAMVISPTEEGTAVATRMEMGQVFSTRPCSLQNLPTLVDFMAKEAKSHPESPVFLGIDDTNKTVEHISFLRFNGPWRNHQNLVLAGTVTYTPWGDPNNVFGFIDSQKSKYFWPQNLSREQTRRQIGESEVDYHDGTGGWPAGNAVIREKLRAGGQPPIEEASGLVYQALQKKFPQFTTEEWEIINTLAVLPCFTALTAQLLKIDPKRYDALTAKGGNLFNNLMYDNLEGWSESDSFVVTTAVQPPSIADPFRGIIRSNLYYHRPEEWKRLTELSQELGLPENRLLFHSLFQHSDRSYRFDF